MSATPSQALQQDFDLSDWSYSQAATNYVDGPTQLPDGFSYLMSGGAPVIDYDPSAGFYGAALASPTGQVVVAFEGTNVYTGNSAFTTAQSIDDVAITYGLQAPSYAVAYDFTETAIKDAESAGYSAGDISLTGHSLGGADAEYVAQQTGLPGTTFGAPGIPTDDTPYDGSNFFDYVDPGDPVGNYAPDGYEDPILQAQNLTHYGQALYAKYLFGDTYLLTSASIAFEAAATSPSPGYAAAEYSAAAASLALAANYYHPLEIYGFDLDLSLSYFPGPAATEIGDGTDQGLTIDITAGQDGGTDIPGLDITAAGALQLIGDAITVDADGQSDSLPLTASHDTFSLSSDGLGGTLLTPGAASSGYVFAGANGATVQGGSGPLYFVGGSGAVSVKGGSGNTSLFGSTTSNSVLRGGSGTNLITASAGSSTLVGGAGASTLIGGSGNTEEFANGAAPVVLIGGSGASTIYGTTGSGAESVFTGSGVAFAGLNGASDTVVGGSGASTVVGGGGQDIFGLIDGHAGGSMAIAGLTASDSIVFGGYSGDPLTSEGVVGGSDLITLSDGTIILLEGVDHTVFRGLT